MEYFDRKTLVQAFTSSLKSMLSTHADMKKWLEEYGIDLNDEQFKKLSKYLELLKKKNQVVNLTRITDSKEAWIKHILDSLMAAPFVSKPGLRVADIGTGGGMPGIPLAILFPSNQFTLVDATQKKVDAINEFIFELNLKNARCIQARIETLGQTAGYRENFDVVLARALAALPTLLELGIPLICPYGKLIAYKGPEYLQELSSAINAQEKLRCEKPQVYHYNLPEDMGQRNLMSITKKTVTDSKYPRRDGTPNKNPL